MKNVIIISSLLAIVACKTETPKEVNLENELDSVSYSLGVNIGENINKQFEEYSLDNFIAGMKGVLNNEEDPKISGEQATAIIQGYFTKKQGQESESMIEEGRKFLETNASKEGVTVLESGLQYEVLAQGDGINMPKLEDNVTTHYHGTLMDGTVFDSSVDRGEPASFPVNGVIKGWTEALQLMSVGSKWKLYVPYDLAYGERGAGPQIGPYSTLVFEVELISIN
jgi:FKBP-type peptidyl-prolyl cis-trans isomerase FklB